MAKWKKTSPWGDYTDPLQNHKFDGELHFTNADDNTIKVCSRIKNILHEAKWHYGKHIGSKKLSNVQNFNKRANSTRHAVKEYVNNKSNNENNNKDKQQ